MLSIVVVTRQCYFNNRLSEFSVFTFFCSWKVHEAWIAYSLSAENADSCLTWHFTNTVTDKSVFSLLCRLSTWHCPHLSVSAAPAARRRCCWAPAPAIDRYLLPTGHSAANPLHAAAAVDRRDGQMNGRGKDVGGRRPPLFWTEIRAKVSPLLQLVT